MEVDDRFFKKAEDRWPVFVIFTSDGTESSAGAREKEWNTTTALPEKMKALAGQLALDHRKMTAWYEVDFQTDSTESKPTSAWRAATCGWRFPIGGGFSRSGGRQVR